VTHSVQSIVYSVAIMSVTAVSCITMAEQIKQFKFYTVSEYNYGNANYVNDKILNVIFTLTLQFYAVLRGWGGCVARFPRN